MSLVATLAMLMLMCPLACAMVTFAFSMLLAAAFNSERTWWSLQMRTLKKVGWSCEGRRGLDKEALGHNSVPKINPIFSCWRAADVTPSPFDKRMKTGCTAFPQRRFGRGRGRGTGSLITCPDVSSGSWVNAAPDVLTRSTNSDVARWVG
jgi:hypothetical protein